VGNKSTPEIRFPGFTGDWEQYKLSEVSNYRNGKAHEKDISENGEFIVINSKFVSTNGEVRKYSDKQLEPMMADEIAFVLSDVPNGRAIARTFLVDKENKYSLNQRIAGITPSKDTNSYFLYILLNRHHYFLRFDDGVGQTNLSKNEVETFLERYPSTEEQTEVGNFLKQLDDTITHHQQELTTLEQTKRGFLQKMFPKEGKSVPEIRFPGFTGNWGLHRLEEILDLENGYAFKSKYFKSVVTKEIVLTPGNVNIGGGFQDGKGRYYDVSGTFPKRFVLNPEDLFVTMTDLTPSAQTLGLPAFIPNDGNVYLHNQRLGKLINYSGDNNFLFHLLCTDQYHKQIVLTASGTTVKHSSPKKILDCLVNIPSKEEQEKIGEFFYNLDHFIGLHQNELKTLKQTKKAFLQKMFI
jgi:type I restriction enzyme S subunit